MKVINEIKVVDKGEGRTYDRVPYFQVAPCYREAQAGEDPNPIWLETQCPDGNQLVVRDMSSIYHSRESWGWVVRNRLDKVLATSEEAYRSAEEAIEDFNGFVDSEFFCYED